LIHQTLDIYTYHNYVGYGLDPKLAPKMMNSDWNFFNSGPQRAKAMIDGWKALGQPVGMELWVGEIAAAWHSGEPGVTNRFISSFWYADALGLLARLNHTGFQRQSLAGGNYGLLNRTTRQPNSDYYVAQLFHDLMGTRVLGLKSDETLVKVRACYLLSSHLLSSDLRSSQLLSSHLLSSHLLSFRLLSSVLICSSLLICSALLGLAELCALPRLWTQWSCHATLHQRFAQPHV
jgi:hypothetical protein